MKTITRILLITALALVTFTGSAIAATVPVKTTTPTKSVQTADSTQSSNDNEGLHLELLYVQVAPQATLTKKCDKKQQKCHGELIMKGVSPYLLTFSNGKPNVAGYILNTRFIKQYVKTKTDNGLNSAFLSYSEKQLTQTVISISNPVYNANEKEMRYDVTFLKPAPRVKAVNHYKDTVLFIDSICAICMGP